MKRISAILLAILMIISLASCGGDKDETAILTLDASGGVFYEIKLDAENGIVHTMTQKTTIDGSLYTEDQLNQLMDLTIVYEEVYNNIEGITYNVERNEEGIVEVIVMDMSNENTRAALKEEDLMPISGDGEISLEKSIENMTANGYTLVKK